jgi:hypothetical protein
LLSLLGVTRRWGAAFCLAALLAACSGDDDGAVVARATTTKPAAAETTEPVATTIPATTTTTVPPPYSFDNSVPAPTLVNTGTDYDAIFRSLDGYVHWLRGHDPDSAKLDEVVVIGTQGYTTTKNDLDGLAESDLRIYDSASVIQQVEVASEALPTVSLRVTYSDRSRVLVRRDGSVADEKDLPPTSTWIVLLSADSTGRWRIASSTPVQDAVVDA